MKGAIFGSTMHPRGLELLARQALALHTARAVLEALEARGVRAVPVKGVVLAPQLYAPGTRPLADVDLLVEPAAFRRAVDTARAQGWELVWDSKTLGNVNFVVGHLAIDVACRFGPAGVSALDVSTVLSRASRAQAPLGFPHWRIELHDHALLVALDAFKDKLGRGKAWAREDLVRLAAGPGFSPELLVQRAREARLCTLLALVADWLLAGGGDPAWAAVRERLRAGPLRPRYMVRYAASLARERPSRRARWYLSALTRAVADTPSRRGLALLMGALGSAQFLIRHRSLSANVWQRREKGAPPAPP
jgi:hypothetical protein